MPLTNPEAVGAIANTAVAYWSALTHTPPIEWSGNGITAITHDGPGAWTVEVSATFGPDERPWCVAGITDAEVGQFTINAFHEAGSNFISIEVERATDGTRSDVGWTLLVFSAAIASEGP